MTDRPPPHRLGTIGRPGRIIGPTGSSIDVQIDVTLSTGRGSEYQRTTTGLEQGAALTVHRRRVPEQATMEILISDKEPFFGALATGQWEFDHSGKTVARLQDAQAADGELRIWDGDGYYRTPAGKQVWVLDKIDGPKLSGTEDGVAKMTLTFGEQPRFATQFTTATGAIDPSLADVAGNSVDRGRQSTVEASPAETASIAAGVF